MSTDLCSSGSKQSPISINSGQTVKCGNRCNLNFYYKTSKLTPILSNQDLFFEWQPGSFINYNSNSYELKYISFVVGGGHIIDDYKPSLEINFHHQNPADTSWLVIAVSADINDSISRSGQFLDQTTKYLPNSINVNNKTSITMPADWNPFNLIPETKSFFTYTGSFYRSPCGENVQWIVFDNQVSVSNSFFGAVQAKLPSNNRPVQPLNNRTVYYSANGSIANAVNYGPGLKCYTEEEFKKACSCAVDTNDIMTAKNRFYLIATAGVSITVIIILLVLWYYSKK